MAKGFEVDLVQPLYDEIISISASNPVGRVEGCGAPRVDEAIQITNTNAKKTNIVKDDATPFLRLQLPPGLSVIQLFF